MIIINFLFAFRMVHANVLDEIEDQKRMIPMFESTVPVSSLVNHFQVFSVFSSFWWFQFYSLTLSMATLIMNWSKWSKCYLVNQTQKKSWLWKIFSELEKSYICLLKIQRIKLNQLNISNVHHQQFFVFVDIRRRENRSQHW